jgi:phosphoribosylformylglycinamidine (FGAM) synthase PurS component
MRWGASIAIELDAADQEKAKALLDVAADAILALPGARAAWVEYLESEEEMVG